MSGNLEGAEEAIQQARSDPFWLAFPIYCLAPVIVEIRLVLAKAEYGRVLEIGEELLGRLHRFEVRSYLPELLDLMGQALARLDRPGEARNRFLEGRREAEAMKAIGHLWPILFHLSQLETNPKHARALRLQARDIIDYIAAHTGRSTFRESFLALPEVTAVMESVS